MIQVLQSCSNEFISPNQTRAIIEDLGSKAMAVLFGGKCTESLASLRYNILVKKVSSAVTPERLPPTASSTKFHCLRAYYQIMIWTEQEGDMECYELGLETGRKFTDSNNVRNECCPGYPPKDDTLQLHNCLRNTPL